MILMTGMFVKTWIKAIQENIFVVKTLSIFCRNILTLHPYMHDLHSCVQFRLEDVSLQKPRKNMEGLSHGMKRLVLASVAIWSLENFFCKDRTCKEDKQKMNEHDTSPKASF